MTTDTRLSFSSLPEILDVGDGGGHNRDAALKATRHLIEAIKALAGVTTMDDDDFLVERAYDCVADLLGGFHWFDIAKELVEGVVAEEAGLPTRPLCPGPRFSTEGDTSRSPVLRIDFPLPYTARTDLIKYREETTAEDLPPLVNYLLIFLAERLYEAWVAAVEAGVDFSLNPEFTIGFFVTHTARADLLRYMEETPVEGLPPVVVNLLAVVAERLHEAWVADAEAEFGPGAAAEA
jgi:hypothetical protein